MSIQQKTPKKVIPITNVTQNKIYPRSTSGYFTNWRWIMVWVTQIVFYGLPWLQLGVRQAVLLDIDTHRFYIFGLVLYPQDLIYLAVILIISALALFLLTTVAGRLWCGFSCPQSVYTKIFLWIERKIEGDRAARIKLDNNKLSINTIYKKSLKHLVWISFSICTGFTFLGYFAPIRELFHGIMQFSLGPWETFWICFYALATYGNAGFLREMVCKHMCPYARFQSVMFDQDTLIVTYDEVRGEPRNGRSRSVNAKENGLGDCIDCSFCVQVCPVGIDIRDGLQYECISCGLCIDACDSVMDKVQYPRGLIRFSTLNGMSNHWSKYEILKKILRPRVLIYGGLLLLICIGFAVSLSLRESFKVDVIRDRGVMSRLTPEGYVENVYQLQVTNVTEVAHSYHISVKGLKGISLISNNEFTVDATSERLVAVSLQMRDGSVRSGTHPIQFEIEELGSESEVMENSVFYVPR
ncbi:MAG: cytochrome c oxidase accessory protein CcoG [Methylotenera sp.]|nr:cytochrome c oxidase accessory protein CcoG [Methylotenera sp.]